MLNLLRKFLRPTLREQLEDGVRAALRKYAERQRAPHLRVFVSTDLVPAGMEEAHWAGDEGEHLRRFALQWAEDNDVPRVGLRVEMVLLDTKREFAFVKPIGVESPAEEGRGSAEPARPAGPIVQPGGGARAVLGIVASPTLATPLEVRGELVIGRRADGDSVFGAGDRYMSSRHARLHIANGTLYITDLDSKNRTFVNERPLPPHEQVPVAIGDQLRMGATVVRVESVEG